MQQEFLVKILNELFLVNMISQIIQLENLSIILLI